MKFEQLLLLGFTLLAVSLPVGAQTKDEVDFVTKTLKRPQTNASTCSFLAGMYMGKGDPSRSIDYYNRMAEIYAADPGLGTECVKYAWALTRKATCLQSAGRTALAESECKRALSIVGGQQHVASDSEYLQTILQDSSQILGREKVQEVIRAVPRKTTPPKLCPIAISEIPNLVQRTKDTEQTLQGVTIPRDMNQAKELLYLANLHCLEKRYGEAEKEYKGVIEFVESVAGKDSQMLATPLSNFGYMLKVSGKQKQATEIEQRLRALP